MKIETKYDIGQDCAFFESCLEYDTCCNFLGDMEGMIFKKSDNK